MTTMEFDELQEIWDSQNNQPLYAINEKALHNRIQSKMKHNRHITNVSELLLILVNLGSGSFVLWVNLSIRSKNIFMYILAAWMFATALYALVSRIRRIKGAHRFDRSMRGDLDHAISVAAYQVRLSQIMRWNILPVAAFVILGILESKKPLWIAGVILVCFALAFYAGNWEHGIHNARKRELEILKEKLETKD